MSASLASRPVKAILTADSSKFVVGMERAAAKLKVFQSKIRNFQTSISSMGRSFSTRLTLPIVAGVGASVKSFATFDDAMTESTSIMGDLSDNTVKQMSELAKGLSLESTRGPSELAKAYFYLASAGMNAEQSMKALGPVLSFAEAGAFDLSTATDLATDAQSALGLASKDAVENQRNMIRVTDVLVKANTLANASTLQFSEALTNKAGAALKILHKDIEEGVAVLAAFADQGLKGVSAGERFSMFVRFMQSAYAENTEVWRKFGIEIYDQAGNLKNLADIVQQLEVALGTQSPKRMVEMLNVMGVTARSQDAFKMLIGASGKIREYEKALRSAAGTTKDVAEKQLKSFGKQLKMVWNHVKVLSIEIGESLAPSIVSIGEKVKEGVTWFRSFTSETKRFVGVVTLIGASIGPVLMTLGALAASLTFIVGAAGMVVSAVSAVVGALSLPVLAAIAIGFTVIVVAVKTLGITLEGSIATVKEWGSSFVEWAKSAVSATVGFFVNFTTNWKKLRGWWSENWKNMFVDAGVIVITFAKNMHHNFRNVFLKLNEAWGVVARYMFDNFGDIMKEALVMHGKAWVKFFVDLGLLTVKAFEYAFKGNMRSLNLVKDLAGSFFKGFTSAEKGESLGTRLSKVDWSEGWKSSLEGFKATTAELPEFKLDWGTGLDKVADALDENTDSQKNVTTGMEQMKPSVVEEEQDRSKTAAALEAGSSAAYEAMYKGANVEQRKIAENTRTTADESVRQTQLLDDISGKLEFETATI